MFSITQAPLHISTLALLASSRMETGPALGRTAKKNIDLLNTQLIEIYKYRIFRSLKIYILYLYV